MTLAPPSVFSKDSTRTLDTVITTGSMREVKQAIGDIGHQGSHDRPDLLRTAWLAALRRDDPAVAQALIQAGVIADTALLVECAGEGATQTAVYLMRHLADRGLLRKESGLRQAVGNKKWDTARALLALQEHHETEDTVNRALLEVSLAKHGPTDLVQSLVDRHTSVEHLLSFLGNCATHDNGALMALGLNANFGPVEPTRLGSKLSDVLYGATVGNAKQAAAPLLARVAPKAMLDKPMSLAQWSVIDQAAMQVDEAVRQHWGQAIDAECMPVTAAWLTAQQRQHRTEEGITSDRAHRRSRP